MNTPGPAGTYQGGTDMDKGTDVSVEELEARIGRLEVRVDRLEAMVAELVADEATR